MTRYKCPKCKMEYDVLTISAALMSLSTIIVAINAQFLSIRKETSSV